MADRRPPHMSRYEKRMRRRSSLLVFAGILALLAWGGWTVSRGPVVLPAMITQQVEQMIDRRVGSTGLSASIDELEFHLRDGRTPVVSARGFVLEDATGQPHLELALLEAVAAPMSGLRGGALVPAVRLNGLQLNVLRDETGALTVRLGNETLASQIRSPGDVVDRLKDLVSQGALRHVTTLGIGGLSITFANEETGNVLSTQGGALRIQKDAEDLIVALALSDFEGANEEAAIGRVRLGLRNAAITNQTSLDLSVGGFVPASLAAIGGSDALTTLLQRLDAPVSLDLDAAVGANGLFEQLVGKIVVGNGHLLLPEATQEAIPLDWARGEVFLGAGQDRLELRDLDVSAGSLKVTGGAHLLVDRTQQFSGPVIVQAALDTLQMDLPTLFDAPLSLENLNADIRLLPEQGQIDVANLSVSVDGARVTANGIISRADAGIPQWGVDVAVATLQPETVLSLWPRKYTPPTREWLTKRLVGGELRNVQAAVRKTGDAPVQLGLSFDFAEASVRPLNWLPPITDASGVVQISGTTLAVDIEQGTLELDTGDRIDLSGGLVRLPNIRERNGTLEVGFDIDTSTASALRLLALPGFRGQAATDAPPEDPPRQILPPEAATGDLALRAELAIPLYRSTRMKDVSYEVTGLVRGFTNDTLVPGRTLAAQTLDMRASPGGLEISGEAELDGHPLRATFWRSLSREPELRGISKVTATAPLTGALLRDFGVPVPANGASGQGTLDVTLDVKPGVAPQLELVGDLKGLGLRVPSVSWSKSEIASGSASVSARLGAGGALDKIDVDAAGLKLSGRAKFGAGGKGLSTLALSRLEIGQWLRTTAQITPGQGRSGGRIALTGGVLDLRNRPRSGGGGSGSGPQLDLALDRLVLNDGISLNSVRGTLSGQGEGRISATVNGGPATQVDISRTSNGPSYRVRSSDAGAVIRAAGFIKNAYGGDLDVRLVPTGGAGSFEGRLRIKDITMRNAPVIAELVSGLSIVGAIEQAAGDGIPFSDVRSEFRVTPRALFVDSASAVGASIGLSLDGRVDLGNGKWRCKGCSPRLFPEPGGQFHDPAR